jgi:GNAT superfamily N-acetyltransferase
MLSNGEYVIRAKAAQAIGTATLDKLNHAEKFAKGGYVRGFDGGGTATNSDYDKYGRHRRLWRGDETPGMLYSPGGIGYIKNMADNDWLANIIKLHPAFWIPEIGHILSGGDKWIDQYSKPSNDELKFKDNAKLGGFRLSEHIEKLKSVIKPAAPSEFGNKHAVFPKEVKPVKPAPNPYLGYKNPPAGTSNGAIVPNLAKPNSPNLVKPKKSKGTFMGLANGGTVQKLAGGGIPRNAILADAAEERRNNRLKGLDLRNFKKSLKTKAPDLLSDVKKNNLSWFGSELDPAVLLRTFVGFASGFNEPAADDDPIYNLGKTAKDYRAAFKPILSVANDIALANQPYTTAGYGSLNTKLKFIDSKGDSYGAGAFYTKGSYPEGSLFSNNDGKISINLGNMNSTMAPFQMLSHEVGHALDSKLLRELPSSWNSEDSSIVDIMRNQRDRAKNYASAHGIKSVSGSLPSDRTSDSIYEEYRAQIWSGIIARLSGQKIDINKNFVGNYKKDKYNIWQNASVENGGKEDSANHPGSKTSGMLQYIGYAHPEESLKYFGLTLPEKYKKYKLGGYKSVPNLYDYDIPAYRANGGLIGKFADGGKVAPRNALLADAAERTFKKPKTNKNTGLTISSNSATRLMAGDPGGAIGDAFSYAMDDIYNNTIGPFMNSFVRHGDVTKPGTNDALAAMNLIPFGKVGKIGKIGNVAEAIKPSSNFIKDFFRSKVVNLVTGKINPSAIEDLGYAFRSNQYGRSVNLRFQDPKHPYFDAGAAPDLGHIAWDSLTGEIKMIHIDEMLRGKGLGKSLFAKAMAHALENGVALPSRSSDITRFGAGLTNSLEKTLLPGLSNFKKIIGFDAKATIPDLGTIGTPTTYTRDMERSLAKQQIIDFASGRAPLSTYALALAGLGAGGLGGLIALTFLKGKNKNKTSDKNVSADIKELMKKPKMENLGSLGNVGTSKHNDNLAPMGSLSKSFFGFANGGMVSKIKPSYFAAGDLARGTDVIPAMLTPGEFIMTRSAVQNFGVDNLRAINAGVATPETSMGESVYNYSINVNVSSNSDANEIAKTVMTQIKRIDSQRVRGVTRG